MQRNSIAIGLLIAAQVLVFGYFGIDKFIAPETWAGYLPTWIDGFFGQSQWTWMSVIGAIEIALAVMVLIPVRSVRRLGVALICLHLVAILWQVGINDIGARDLGLLLGAAALLALL